MNWAQFATFVFVNLSVIVGMLIWLTTRDESFRKESYDFMMSNREELLALMASQRVETHALIESIKEDIKDFHGRLCAIEERRK